MKVANSYPKPQLIANTAGLGLRRPLLEQLAMLPASAVDFMEIAPENWINIGGRQKKVFNQIAERFPIHLHGLSLNIGGVAPLDMDLVRSIRDFKQQYQCPIYTEHLTYCGDDGHLYDLMPIPFTEEAVHHVAARVKQVEDCLGERIALENASYYCAPDQQMTESEFITAVLEEADCDLLLDVNNIYVNSINHSYDPYEFLMALPLERACYIHVAGHYEEEEDLRIDTHGAEVIDPVWEILKVAYEQCGPLPTLLERDFNFPPMEELLKEVDMIRALQQQSRSQSQQHSQQHSQQYPQQQTATRRSA